MSILITGGTGFLGANLAKSLFDLDEEIILFDLNPNYERIRELWKKDRIKVVNGEVSLWSEVLETFAKYKVSEVFHFAAILSAEGEEHPMRAYEVNFKGAVNVLEAARLTGVKKVIFASSIASYGPGLPSPTPEDVPQRPTTIYGISKVFGELLGLYYARKYGLDFRAYRLPAVIGPGRGGGGVSTYSTLIFEKAALGEPYEVYVDEDATIPIIYYKDVLKAFLLLRKAPEGKSRVYNLSGISPTAKEIVDAVKRVIPDAALRFSPKPELVAVIDSWPKALDETRARLELGWRTTFTLEEMVRDFVREKREEASKRERRGNKT